MWGTQRSVTAWLWDTLSLSEFSILEKVFKGKIKRKKQKKNKYLKQCNVP